MFSKNEARPKYNAEVLKEAYGKENKKYRVYDKFVANPRMHTLCGKFYAQHDREDLDKADKQLMDILKDYFDRLPAQRFSEPVLESHEVGWYARAQLIPLRKRDNRFYHPKIKTITKMIRPVKKKSDSMFN